MGKKGGKKSPSKLKALKNALEQAEASLQAKVLSACMCAGPACSPLVQAGCTTCAAVRRA